MAKRVFFSFDYKDVETFRANVVRNHDFTKENGQEAGYIDASIWEEAKKHQENSVERMINSSLEGTSVTCVLIGTGTWSRPWVRYEILKSFDRDNLLIGVHINSVSDKNSQTFSQGNNPFYYLGFWVSEDGKKQTYSEHDGTNWIVYQDLPAKAVNYAQQHRGKWFRLADWVPCYDWTSGDGFNNFSTWVGNAK
jgi:hypothetical protein